MQRVERRLLAACDQVIAQVPLPRPFNINRYRKALEEVRERPIRLLYSEHVAKLDAAHPYAIWLATDTEDRVYLRPDASPLHQALTFLHEVGHMQHGHDRGCGPMDGERLDHLLANAAQVGRELGMYTHRDEREAELFASRVMEHAGHAPAWRPDGRNRNLVDRLAESLGHPVRPERAHG